MDSGVSRAGRREGAGRAVRPQRRGSGSPGHHSPSGHRQGGTPAFVAHDHRGRRAPVPTWPEAVHCAAATIVNDDEVALPPATGGCSAHGSGSASRRTTPRALRADENLTAGGVSLAVHLGELGDRTGFPSVAPPATPVRAASKMTSSQDRFENSVRCQRFLRPRARRSTRAGARGISAARTGRRRDRHGRETGASRAP